MPNIVIFGPPDSGKTTILGYLSTAMYRHPQFNEEVYHRLKMIKKLTKKDDFKIGEVSNPVNIKTQVILPSFVSLDLDELRKFRGGNTIGTSKRLHRRELSICTTGGDDIEKHGLESHNLLSRIFFIDIPGFSNCSIKVKYQSLFEGDIGLAVLDFTEIRRWVKLQKDLDKASSAEEIAQLKKDIKKYERRFFDPIRIWCDYTYPERLILVISKIDRDDDKEDDDKDDDVKKDNILSQERVNEINACIISIRNFLKTFTDAYDKIPITPISITLSNEEYDPQRSSPRPKMRRFFHRNECNIYQHYHGQVLGSGTLIECLTTVINNISGDIDVAKPFSMASVSKIMKTQLNHTDRAVFQIRALHGDMDVEKLRAEKVLLGPVKLKGLDSPTYCKCNIASLKADGTKPSSDFKYDVLSEGNVGGMIATLRDSESNRVIDYDYEPQESQISLLKTTILFTGNAKTGDIVQLIIYEDEHKVIEEDHIETDDIYNTILRRLMPYDTLALFWYGKKILVQVVEIFYDEKAIRLSVAIAHNGTEKTPFFVLPADQDHKIRFNDSVLLGINKSLYEDHNSDPQLYTYVVADILDIKSMTDVSSIKLTVDNDLCLSVLLAGKLRFERLYNDIDNTETLQLIIKNGHDPHNILANLGREIRKALYREEYEIFGGAVMELCP